ncbi:MAG: hypothetical protein PVI43_00925 [Candidatus Bathyarchaeota archaeon]|jgi:hypothetical protein
MSKIIDLYGQPIAKKPTVGEEAVKRMEKPDKMEVGEVREGTTKDYMKELTACATRGLDEANYTGDFYVIAMRKRERHMVNVLRTIYYHRQTKPSPMWDMDCWRVTQSGDLFFCWSLPDMQTGHDIMENPSHFKQDSPELVQFVWMFVNDML